VVLAYPVANTEPVAVLDQGVTYSQTPVRLDPLANDFDPENDTIRVLSVADPGSGTATLGADGMVTYLPDNGFMGPEVFGYVIEDARGAIANGVIQVNVSAFSAFDQNDDGLNDFWQAFHGLPAGSALLDDDWDGLLNREEFAWGSDPGVFNHAPYLEFARPDPGTLRVRVINEGSRGAVLQESGDLVQWSDSGAPLVADGQGAYSDYLIGVDSAYFRTRPDGGVDLDSDFVEDWLETNVFGTSSSAADTDRDGRSDLEEVLGGDDPVDHFNGEAVSLKLVSGSGRVVRAGEVMPELLGVRACGADGRVLAGVRIFFSLVEGSGELRALTGSGFSTAAIVSTDAAGIARVVARAGSDASGRIRFSAAFADPVAMPGAVEFQALVELTRSPHTSFVVLSQDQDSIQLQAPTFAEVTRYLYTYDGSTPDQDSLSVLPGQTIDVPLGEARILKVVAEENGTFGPLQKTYLGDVQARKLAVNENLFWAALDDGNTFSMGLNTRSQLGYNTTSPPLTAEQFEPFVGEARSVTFAGGAGVSVASVALSLDAAIFLDTQGRVWETRDGTPPFQLVSLANSPQVAAGADYRLVLKPDGTVVRWGHGEAGLQLGSSPANSILPVSGLANVEKLFAGYDFAFALDGNGDLKAWGRNPDGNLGLGHLNDVATPAVVGLSNVANLVFGGVSTFAGKQIDYGTESDLFRFGTSQRSTFALTTAGEVYAWGGNGRSELGLGHELEVSTPVRVPGLNPVSAVVASQMGGFAFALDQDGVIHSWGRNEEGQLGDGSREDRNAPITVILDERVTAIAAGRAHALALREDGRVLSWGANGESQLGNGTGISTATPALVPGLQQVVAIAAAQDYSLALRQDGALFFWGALDVNVSNGWTSVDLQTVRRSAFPVIVSPSPVHPAPVVVTDGNGNNIDDAWETRYFGYLPGGTGLFQQVRDHQSEDFDFDGRTNFQEFQDGTHPLDPHSCRASSTDYVVGATQGQFDVGDNGAARYSLPVSLPGGAGGVQPELSLSYNSNNVSGILGQGWMLGGYGVITRGPTTLVTDGFVDGADFDENDVFYLNGQRLIAVNGEYGADGTEYRTEQNAFSRIYSRGRHLNGPTSFEVWTKSGLIEHYRVLQDYAAPPYQVGADEFPRDGVLTWPVASIEDRTGNLPTSCFVSMTFNYGLNFFGALENQESLSQRTTLNRITETGADGRQRAPLTFRYAKREAADHVQWVQDDSFCPMAPLVGAGGADLGIRFLDLNRDGLLDYVRAQGSGPGVTSTYLLQTRDGAARWQGGTAQALPVGVTDAAGNPNGTLLVDLNRDGQADILHAVRDGGTFETRAYLATPTGWELAPEYAPPGALKSTGSSRGEAVQVRDLNGDSLPDFIFAYESAGGMAERVTLLNTGSGWSAAADLDWFLPVPLVNESLGDNGVRLFDANGDQLPDLLQSIDIGGDEIRRVWLNTGQGWSRSADRRFFPPVDFTLTPGLQDLNGDGLLDIAAREGFLNTGAGWTSFVLPADATEGARFLDFNGDGLLDILLATDQPFMQRRAWRNVGHGFRELLANSVQQSPIALNVPGVLFIDINGDGVDDIVDGSANGPRCWLNQAGGADLLVKVQPTGGAAIELDYARLNEGDGTYAIEVADPGSGMIDVVNGSRVVKEVRTDNGIGGQFVRSYRYRGLRNGTSGEGNLGFRRRSITDEQTGIVTTTTYRQDYPLVGLPEKVVSVSGAQTITQQESDYALVGYVPNVPVSWFSYTSRMTETRWDLSGAFLGQSATSFTYDDYGNVTSSQIDYGEEWSQAFVNVWNNAEANWEIGRLAEVTAVKNGAGGDSITRHSTFSYDPMTGHLKEEVEEPGTEFEVRRRYERN